MLKRTVTYCIVLRWLPTKNLRRVTSQKSEGLYSALVHSIDCLAIFCWPLSG